MRIRIIKLNLSQTASQMWSVSPFLTPPPRVRCVWRAAQSWRRQLDRPLSDLEASKAVVRAGARRLLDHAYSTSPDIDAVVTAFVLAATRASVSAGSIGRTEFSAMGSVRACRESPVLTAVVTSALLRSRHVTSAIGDWRSKRPRRASSW
jgi:hypothetical protein